MIKERKEGRSNGVKIKRNKFSLLDKKRFEVLEREKKECLRSLTAEKSIEILEALTSREALADMRDCAFINSPLSLKIGLKIRKNGIAA